MIQKVFAVRDSKAQAFLQPFFSNAVGSAVRAFNDVVNDRVPNNQIAKHPEDYILYELGDFNDGTGEFVCCTPIKMLGCGADFVNAKVKPMVSERTLADAVGLDSDISREVEVGSNGK